MYSQPSQKCCFDPGGDWCNGVNASLKLEMSDWQIWLNQGMMVRERKRAPQGRTKATLLPTPSEQREQSKNAKWRMQVVNRKDNIQTFTPKVVMRGTNLGPQAKPTVPRKRETGPNWKPPIRGTRLREKRAKIWQTTFTSTLSGDTELRPKTPAGREKKDGEGTHKTFKEEKKNVTKLFSLLDLCEDIYKKQYPVTDGKTQRKNVVLISMEIGAMALNGNWRRLCFLWKFASRCGI